MKKREGLVLGKMNACLTGSKFICHDLCIAKASDFRFEPIALTIHKPHSLRQGHHPIRALFVFHAVRIEGGDTSEYSAGIFIRPRSPRSAETSQSVMATILCLAAIAVVCALFSTTAFALANTINTL